MQYNMDDERQLTPLPAQNIDTGMGLERIAALKQGVTSVFLTDGFRPLVELGEEIAGKRFGDDERVDVALRVLADHSRAMSILIADGVLPEQRGARLRPAPHHPPRRPLQPQRRHGAAVPAALRRADHRTDGRRLPRTA